MNPFQLARLEVHSREPAERALAGLDRLLREGFDAGGRRYRLFGARHGRDLSMSLGLPLVGGAAPVLSARLLDGAGAARFDVNVHARLELVVLALAWTALIVLGGGFQVALRLRDLLGGRASSADVWAVLPGISVMAVCAALAFFYFRRRAARDAVLLVGAFRSAIGAAPDRPPLAALPPT